MTNVPITMKLNQANYLQINSNSTKDAEGKQKMN